MSPTLGFPLALGITVLLLVVVVMTGLKARLRVHIPAVGAVILSLGVTIYFAKRLGESYDIEAAGVITPIHMFLAKTATVSYVLPVVTGALTLKNRAYKRRHFFAAMTALTLTGLAAITGCFMLYWAPLLAE